MDHVSSLSNFWIHRDNDFTVTIFRYSDCNMAALRKHSRWCFSDFAVENIRHQIRIIRTWGWTVLPFSLTIGSNCSVRLETKRVGYRFSTEFLNFLKYFWNFAGMKHLRHCHLSNMEAKAVPFHFADNAQTPSAQIHHHVFCGTFKSSVPQSSRKISLVTAVSLTLTTFWSFI